MRILVKTAEVVQEVTQKGNTLYKQQVALENGGQFPLPFHVTIQKDKPYSPGVYDFHPSSFRVGRFGGIELDPYNIHLVATAAEAPRAAASK